ncbi:MAG: hypothetical protein H0U87_06070 [Acidobacteria bacterium]|nr:hypothetical protein [Acidobacteriota bacterium]
MHGTEVERRFAQLDAKQKEDNYNFETFRAKYLINDAQRTVAAEGIQPGELAPDFELPEVGGGAIRFNDLRGRPTILHFGSYS